VIIEPKDLAGIEVLDHDETRPLYPDELKVICLRINEILGEPQTLFSSDSVIWAPFTTSHTQFEGYLIRKGYPNAEGSKQIIERLGQTGTEG